MIDKLPEPIYEDGMNDASIVAIPLGEWKRYHKAIADLIDALNNLERQAFWLTDNDRLTMNRPETPTPEGQMTGGVPQYPCADCGKLRTKDEGGTTFTVCDECWDKNYKKPPCTHKHPDGREAWVSGAYIKKDGYTGTGEFCEICGQEK